MWRSPVAPVAVIFMRSRPYVLSPRRWAAADSVSPGMPKLRTRSHPLPAPITPSTGSSLIVRPSRNIPFTTSWMVASFPIATRNRYPSSRAEAASAEGSDPFATKVRCSKPRSSSARSSNGSWERMPARGSTITAIVPKGLVMTEVPWAKRSYTPV